ncbi:hypothetical protein ACFFX0_32510 [Citricoccus parietis]|uniref:Uncharacterized protein n=1 Tax=Citricoccus parietis TaxID=592307 RepID=A0ABV5GAJ8_9MICC
MTELLRGRGHDQQPSPQARGVDRAYPGRGRLPCSSALGRP